MKPLVLLDTRTSIRPVHAEPEVGDRVDVLDQYELPRADLAPYSGMLVTAMADQELL